MTTLQNINCECADFAELRQSGSVYVDKTALIHRILTNPSYKSHFLSRPRRFGKSLLCSTFKAIFEGRRELFRGLDFESLPWDWEHEKRPVAMLSMTAASDVEECRGMFLLKVRELCKKYGVVLGNNITAAEAFYSCIHVLASHSSDGRIAVIIDEYDAPLLHSNMECRDKMRELLASIYGQLKDCSECIRFLFITGITRFSKISVFSQLNNFETISQDSEYATLLGYTEDELERYFSGHIAVLSQRNGMDEQCCKREIIRMYNGFRFTESPLRTLNPFSLANVLTKKEFGLFWAESGTPTFLATEMRRRHWLPSFRQGETICHWSDFQFFDMASASPEMLLFQSGYLTIKEIGDTQGIPRNPRVVLDFPNVEVRYAMLWNFFNFLEQNASKPINTYADDVREAALRNDLAGLVRLLKSHFDSLAGCDTEFIRRYEGFYQTIITTILQFAACQMDYHLQGNLGIQDAAIYSADTIYIFELKVNGSPEEAIRQCITKNYPGRYVRDGRRILLVGLNCNSETRSLDEHYLVREYRP